MKVSFSRSALCVVLLLALLLPSCAESDSRSAFDLSLGQYIGSKSYEEMLDILKLDPETAEFENMVLSLGDVDYDGTPFSKSLAFSVDDNYNSTLGSVSYSHIFDESASPEAVKQVVEKIYTELGTQLGGEPLTDARYSESTIADMLAGEGLGGGVSYWAADDAGCEAALICQSLDMEPPYRYRITVVEYTSQDN